MGIRTFTFASIVVIGMGMTFAATPAQAVVQKPRHCVVDVSAANARMACYDSFTTAIAEATRGRVTDAPADVRKAMRDPKLIAELNDPTPAASAVLSIEWDGSNYTGHSVTVTAPIGCTLSGDDIDWQVPSLEPGLDDQISSYMAFSGCWVKHWEHPNYTGLSIGFDGGQADMGEMDNKTSSIQWT
jgi:hypothetical protein